MVIAQAGPLCRSYADAGAGEAAQLQAGVLRWRLDLQQALGPQLPAALNWNELTDGATMTTDLGPSGLLALRLLAVYAQRTDLELPDVVPAIPELDRAYREAADQKFGKSHFGQLLAADLWLPVDFAFTARAPLPDGREGEIGSLPVLLDQLRRLNGRTFQVDPSAMAGWLTLPAEPGLDLLDAARRGLAGLLTVAAFAEAAAVPLLLRD